MENQAEGSRIFGGEPPGIRWAVPENSTRLSIFK